MKQGDGVGDYRECSVSEFGEFGVVDAQTYYYALSCLIPTWGASEGKCGDDSFAARYHRTRALAVFAGDPANGGLQLVFERADPEIGLVVYRQPELVENAAGTLLHLWIKSDGSGNHNESEYYLRVAGHWERIETEAWLSDLRQRLPAGLEIWRGIWPDLHTMLAEASLYRAGDANCCPSGGIARIQLAIREKRLLLDSLVVEETP